MFEEMKLLILKNWKSILKFTISSIILIFIFYDTKNTFYSLNIANTLYIIINIPIYILTFLYILGLLTTSFMTLYDFIFLKNFKNKINFFKLFGISFTSNSLINFLGFNYITCTSLKSYLFEKRYLKIKDILQYNTFIAISTATGLSALSIFLLFKITSISNILYKHKWLFIGIIFLIIYLIIYFLFDKILYKINVPMKKINSEIFYKLKIKLFSISVIEWISSYLLFYYIVYYFNKDIEFTSILLVFSISCIAGIMSLLPRGILFFDIMAMWGLQHNNIDIDYGLAIVILYRIFYFTMPSVTSSILLLFKILLDKHKNIENLDKESSFKKIKMSINNNKLYSDLISVLLSILIFVSSLTLIFSTIIPGEINRVYFISEITSPIFIQVFKGLSIIIGFCLLTISGEILHKVKRACNLCVYLLCLGIIVVFFKNFSYEQSIFLLMILALVKFSQSIFYRKSINNKLINYFFLFIISSVFTLFYINENNKISYYFVNKYGYPKNFFGSNDTFTLILFIFYILFILFLIFWYLSKDKIENDMLYSSIDIANINEFLSSYEGNTFTHLIYLNDKNIFWSKDNNVMIIYSKFREKIIVLGDPIGDINFFSKAIQEFQRFLDLYGYECVFYQVSKQNLSLYHDNGYYFFKLGEEAIIDLEEFNLNGSKKSSFRNILKRFEKDGFSFEIINPPFDIDFINNLKLVSNEWLGNRKEKGFSLGYFKDEYLQKSPIAILKNIYTDEIIAFVSILPHYNNKKSVSIDLMRIKNKVPNSTMDYLILNLLIYFKDNGYKYFNLGMAPLANVGFAPNSHIQEKLAKLVYKYGQHFYSFDGLRRYKEKFKPTWKARYLAYPSLISLPETLLEISMLISSSKKVKHKKPNN